MLEPVSCRTPGSQRGNSDGRCMQYCGRWQAAPGAAAAATARTRQGVHLSGCSRHSSDEYVSQTSTPRPARLRREAAAGAAAAASARSSSTPTRAFMAADHGL